MQQKQPVLEVMPETTGNARFLNDEKGSCKAVTRLNIKPELDALEIWVRGLTDTSNPDRFNIR